MPDSPEKTAIRAAEARDAKAVADIYNHYVLKSAVTFEEEPVTSEEIARRMQQVRSARLPWLVAEMDRHIVGYAHATPWKTRTAYRFSVEITVYLVPERGGRGIGSALYSNLLAILQARGIHAVIGGIALPNQASVALHEKFGLRKVAHFEQVGFKFNRWIDVGYWQRTLQSAPLSRE
jgi:phosphinothricin acetyltransferase